MEALVLKNLNNLFILLSEVMFFLGIILFIYSRGGLKNELKLSTNKLR